MVQLKESVPAAANIAAAQGQAPQLLPGVTPQRAVGLAGNAADAAQAITAAKVAAAKQAGGASSSLQANPPFVYTITDGSSVEDKLAELSRHPGVCMRARRAATACCAGTPPA